MLLRDEVQALELNVIDIYQAGEVRSTKNLSGGESFIVSLALALGLSRMSSKNVRVDSLFLDEGFGSLDDDALDVALETLSGLAAGRQADRDYFPRSRLERTYQHPDCGDTAGRGEKVRYPGPAAAKSSNIFIYLRGNFPISHIQP